jgi:hypothetical protein
VLAIFQRERAPTCLHCALNEQAGDAKSPCVIGTNARINQGNGMFGGAPGCSAKKFRNNEW